MATIKDVVDKLEQDLDDFFKAWDAFTPVEVPEIFLGKYHVRRRQMCEQCRRNLTPRRRNK